MNCRWAALAGRGWLKNTEMLIGGARLQRTLGSGQLVGEREDRGREVGSRKHEGNEPLDGGPRKTGGERALRGAHPAGGPRARAGPPRVRRPQRGAGTRAPSPLRTSRS